VNLHSKHHSLFASDVASVEYNFLLNEKTISASIFLTGIHEDDSF
jgi:hypothetical protein